MNATETETLRVLSLLSAMASTHLNQVEIDDAEQVILQALAYYRNRHGDSSEATCSALKCNVQVLALQLYKVGSRQKSIGQIAKGDRLVETGSKILRLVRCGAKSITADQRERVQA